MKNKKPEHNVRMGPQEPKKPRKSTKNWKFEYAQKFRTREWQMKRAKILERDNYECKGDPCMGSKDDMLHVHHIVYLKNMEPWDYDDDFLITLCSECHKEIREVNIKDIIIEHTIKYGVDEALIEFFKRPVMARIFEMWNLIECDSIKDWYAEELEIREYLDNYKPPKQNDDDL